MIGHGPGVDLNGPVLKDLMNNRNEHLDELEGFINVKDLNLCLLKTFNITGKSKLSCKCKGP